MTIHLGQPWRALRVDDQGSATADMVLLTPLLILRLLLIVFCGRLAASNLRVIVAAHQAARAASLARMTTSAQNAAGRPLLLVCGGVGLFGRGRDGQPADRSPASAALIELRPNDDRPFSSPGATTRREYRGSFKNLDQSSDSHADLRNPRRPGRRRDQGFYMFKEPVSVLTPIGAGTTP